MPGGAALEPVILAGLCGFAVIGTITQLRWCLVAALFLLVAYIPDTLADQLTWCEAAGLSPTVRWRHRDLAVISATVEDGAPR